MSRRIDTTIAPISGSLGRSNGSQTNEAFRNTVNGKGFAGYSERLLKYIPAELVGLYLTARGIVPQGQAESGQILWAIAIATWVLVPLYLCFATSRDGDTPQWWQVMFGTLAFPVWVFAIGGRPVSELSWYHGREFVGSIILMFVTVLFGLKQP